MSASGENESNGSGRYEGELAHRRPIVAFLLGLIAPGLGWAYLGRGVGALAVNLAFVLLWAALAVAWVELGFFPVPAVLAAVAGTVGLTLMSAADAAAAAASIGPRYVLRPSNHPIVYALIAALGYVLPLAGVYAAVVPRLLGVAVVLDDAMYPTLLPGDRVLVDRTAVAATMTHPGDVVLFRRDGADGALDVGRIVAGPGQSVNIVDGIIFVNDTPFPQGQLATDASDAVERLAGPLPDTLEVRIESNGHAVYLVSAPRLASWGEPTAWTLGDTQYFIMHDNRGDIDDSRTFGPIEAAHIVGRPMHVAYSDQEVTVRNAQASVASHLVRAAQAMFVSPHEGPRAARSGRRIQPVDANADGLWSRGGDR